MKDKREFTLPSRIESVDEAASEAEAFVKQNGYGDDFVSAIDLAVRESVANAVKHGNKFDPEKSVEVTLQTSPEGIEIIVRDFGPGFDLEEIPDPTNPENLLKASGRGILFMRSFMDHVEWHNHDEGGMLVKMAKWQ
ncbi:MAG TPA: ATP-binding protein [Pyrinomonadaceae bacterium]|nr:ATP-binding protein [Pyrinomonadaceae bacterium]